uniref:Methionyl-tRNA formyltransferase n=1 Tax=uncultured Flavobacteriia bacterium TaxID=212695 RepID=H6RH61_9BACT|nr:methionyl-tRNA formyltransferase [uncultured bacterium]CCG00372.1 Methionyl-tRNA formyltransferase [uncultured Flavobacteriia bacterium]CCG00412.1 Methionyl-tRNA formyltransferase [uncultured Flavobacteriia bacterium]
MNELKIIFFGTPSFAVDSLHEINLNYNVVCAVTSPDKKSGRGQKINESKVKQYAKKNNIKILQPENLNDKEFINQIEAIQPDLIIVVAYRKLPFDIFSIPKYGTINLHASLLPNYRGAAPINWCLINNEKKTGVTTFFINEKIDQGDVLLKEEIIISDEDDFGTLYLKLSSIGSKLLVKTINGVVTDTLKASKQLIDEDLKIAPKISKENTRIIWNKPTKEILGKIRGLSPIPGAWTILKNGDIEIRMKILKAEIGKKILNKKVGKILIHDKELHVYSEGRIINCTLIQLENKRVMSAKDLINGLKLDENSHVY